VDLDRSLAPVLRGEEDEASAGRVRVSGRSPSPLPSSAPGLASPPTTRRSCFARWAAPPRSTPSTSSGS